MFNSAQKTKYVQNLTRFLKTQGVAYPKFEKLEKTKGRFKAMPDEMVIELESITNTVAAAAEIAPTLSKRFFFAKCYRNLNNSQIARKINVSRELCRRWQSELNRPTESKLLELQHVLHVPSKWLRSGDPKDLPADSQIGLRVGKEQRELRESLWEEMKPLFESRELENLSNLEACKKVDRLVEADLNLSALSRKSGGRWQCISGVAFWAPWQPLSRGAYLKKRFWTDETEGIITEALMNNPSIYGAWKEIKCKCETKGLSYPKMISLYKRVEKENDFIHKFGIDLQSAFCTQEPIAISKWDK